MSKHSTPTLVACVVMSTLAGVILALQWKQELTTRNKGGRKNDPDDPTRSDDSNVSSSNATITEPSHVLHNAVSIVSLTGNSTGKDEFASTHTTCSENFLQHSSSSISLSEESKEATGGNSSSRCSHDNSGSAGGQNKDVQLNLGTWENDWSVEESKCNDRIIGARLTSLEESKQMLRRTRAVTVMANRFMLAKTEVECYELVSRLIVSLFSVERCSYALMTDATHWTIKQCSASKEGYSKELVFSYKDIGINAPLENSSIGYCAETLETLYTPDCRKSPYWDHKKIVKMGLRTGLNVPILVGDRQFAGTLNLALKDVDGFAEFDILLIKDIALSLGVNLYTKRLQEAEDNAHVVLKQFLHSMIPPVVISKIEHYWQQSGGNPSTTGTNTPSEEDSDASAARLAEKVAIKERYSMVKCKLERIRQINRIGSMQDLSTIQSEPTMVEDEMSKNQNKSAHVLYAEMQSNVSIVFADIVGFSRITTGLPPILVMEMLHDLFYRFDYLCEKHGVKKLETIGDAYLACAGLLEDTEDTDGGKEAARRCLAMAKDMVTESRNVIAPCEPSERLQIRVGIHVGDLSCGVLGQTIPKFSVYGNAVNMAARMEQTSAPGKINVSRAFHDLIGEDETEWEEKKIISIKNMGEVEAWLLDPVLI